MVNTYALAKLQDEMTPQLKAGFIEDTLLDPHAANNDVVSGKQVSLRAGRSAGLAKGDVSTLPVEGQGPAAPTFPSIGQRGQGLLPAHSARGHGDGGIYNLWGQVPVKSEARVHYYNLTAMGVTHSGKTGVS